MTKLMLPMVDPSPVAPPGVSSMVNTVLGYIMWTGGVVAVAALLIGGIVIMLNAYGRAGDNAERIVQVLGMVFIGAVIIGSAGAIGSALVPGV